MNNASSVLSVIYSEGPTSTLLNSSSFVVWTSDSYCGDIIYSKSPTNTLLDSSRLAI